MTIVKRTGFLKYPTEYDAMQDNFSFSFAVVLLYKSPVHTIFGFLCNG